MEIHAELPELLGMEISMENPWFKKNFRQVVAFVATVISQSSLHGGGWLFSFSCCGSQWRLLLLLYAPRIE